MCSFLDASGIKEGPQEDDMGVGESRRGLDYSILNKMMCSFEGGSIYFKGVLVNQEAHRQRTGLA